VAVARRRTQQRGAAGQATAAGTRLGRLTAGRLVPVVVLTQVLASLLSDLLALEFLEPLSVSSAQPS
jgi:hypothetical protein